MMMPLLALLLSQNPAQVIIVDPSTRPATNTGSTASPIKVTCVSGCSAGGGGSVYNVTVDAGRVTADQGNSKDGGLSWPVELLGTPAVSIPGSVAVTGPLTDTQLRASPVIMTVDGGSL